MNSSSSHKQVTNAIQSQLVRAWRERWTDVEWSVHLKALLPQDAPSTYTGDAYQLPGNYGLFIFR